MPPSAGLDGLSSHQRATAGATTTWTEPTVDPAKDKRVSTGFYSVMPSPVDGSIWGSYRAHPGAVVRVDPVSNPPETPGRRSTTCRARLRRARRRHRQKGVVWVSLAAATSAASTARSARARCNGPKATGDHCPEGWAFHHIRAPASRHRREQRESSYYTWVDQHNTFGLGDDVPMFHRQPQRR